MSEDERSQVLFSWCAGGVNKLCGARSEVTEAACRAEHRLSLRAETPRCWQPARSRWASAACSRLGPLAEASGAFGGTSPGLSLRWREARRWACRPASPHGGPPLPGRRPPFSGGRGAPRPPANRRPPYSWCERRGRGGGCPCPFPRSPRRRRRCRGPAGGQPAPPLRSPRRTPRRNGRCEYGGGKAGAA